MAKEAKAVKAEREKERADAAAMLQEVTANEVMSLVSSHSHAELSHGGGEGGAMPSPRCIQRRMRKMRPPMKTSRARSVEELQQKSSKRHRA